MNWEAVHTINEYYDGPRFGVADYNGEPFIYESKFSYMIDDNPEEYRLSKIEESLYTLVMRDWKIWLKWEKAFKVGNVGVESHPCLPEDKEEHIRIQENIAGKFEIDIGNYMVRKAEFRLASNEPWRLEVKWFI